jgi:hypothetical protein
MPSSVASKLRSLGKTVFVEFYNDFKQFSNGSLSVDELANKLLEENLRSQDNTFETQKGRARNGKQYSTIIKTLKLSK